MIKLLVIDDSKFIHNLFTLLLAKRPDIHLFFAEDVMEARQKIPIIQPNIITLDIEMPQIDGITFLKELVSTTDIPVIMVSSSTKADSLITKQVLDIGAADYIAKPSDARDYEDIEALSHLFIQKITKSAKIQSNVNKNYVKKSHDHVILISTKKAEDVPSIITLISMLKVGTPATFIHIPTEHSISTFANRLNSATSFGINIVNDQMVIEKNNVYIADVDYAINILRSDNQQSLIAMPSKPAVIDTTIISAAEAGVNIINLAMSKPKDDMINAFNIVEASGGSTVIISTKNEQNHTPNLSCMSIEEIANFIKGSFSY